MQAKIWTIIAVVLAIAAIVIGVVALNRQPEVITQSPQEPSPGAMTGSGVLAGMWCAKPLNGVSLQRSNTWQDVPNTSVSFTLDRPAVLFCTYSINVQPNDNPGVDYLGTRLSVNDMPYRESGSHVQPFPSPIGSPQDKNLNLNGNLVVELDKGTHNVKLQWWKSGGPSWSNDPGWPTEYIGGRTVVVIAFYK